VEERVNREEEPPQAQVQVNVRAGFPVFCLLFQVAFPLSSLSPFDIHRVSSELPMDSNSARRLDVSHQPTHDKIGIQRIAWAAIWR
jgi:hypothetical protein